MTLRKIANALIESGGLAQGRFQQIYEALAQAFAIAKQLQVPDGIAYVGRDLAPILALDGLFDEALAVVADAEVAFAKLGDKAGLTSVAELRRLIEQRKNAG